MNDERVPLGDPEPLPVWFAWLERFTAALLVVILLTLGWMVWVVYQPAWSNWASTETEVIVVLVLLAAALGLVSVVALLHTRAR